MSEELSATDTSAMLTPRYAEIATFLRAPLAGDWSAVDIGLFGIPYDGGITNRAGARHGPRAIRDASSLMRMIHHVTRFNPYEVCRVADLGDVRFRSVYDHETVMADIAAFAGRAHQAGMRPFAVGGDHSVSLGLLRAAAERHGPLGLVHVDAHTDTWDQFHGSKFMHATPFRRAVEEGLIDPKRSIQIGIRGAQNSPEGWEYSREQGMRVMFIEEAQDLGPAAVAAEARRVVGEGKVYLSFDIDGLDPVYAPGTGTPEAGGLSIHEAQRFLRALDGLDFIGADLVEVAPPFDVGDLTSLSAATLIYEILCIMAGRYAA
ncbi:agmatinase [Aquibaculum arenosum]|uniref:Agmatinase n=1 Tax=Aquibaculum arenosum TaxID=3032591 RepID=A0ABT5YP75_9PROT|nr:agmatinase [Fodinicurvata sp. CAU 1616]MDF2096633.1 agmatinase [Fodinicurvata sp. CAU 1616]